jgi:hypothetical protein
MCPGTRRADATTSIYAVKDRGRHCRRRVVGRTLGMEWRSRITIEPGKRAGKPTIRGLRITVSDVLLSFAA